MVTNCQTKPMANSDLLSFLKVTGCNSMHFDLLRFVGRHPKARLSLYVLTRATGTRSITLGNAIIPLLEQDILVAQIDDNGLTTYSLSTSQKTCGYIYRLVNLDWSEARSLRRQLKDDVSLQHSK